MTKKDFILIAETLEEFVNNTVVKERLAKDDRDFLIDLFAVRLARTNWRFDNTRFWQKALGVESLNEARK